MPSALVFDIETVGLPWESFDEMTQKMLIGPLEDGDDPAAKVAEAQGKLGLSPLTGQIVSIAAIDAESGKGAVYYQAPGQTVDETIDGIRFASMPEKDILEQFWRLADRFDEFVTFNGRGFDLPFILLRSAVHKMRPPKHLMKARYLYQQNADARHIDLMDQLSFYGATRNTKLHMYCQALGIPTPKEAGDGSEVQTRFTNGEYRAIADYNVKDVQATAALYHVWHDFLRLS
jgi:3'-5' exonuclease